MFSSSIQVTQGSANTMILRSRLWLIDNRIVGGADGLCAGLDRQLGGYLGLGSGHTGLLGDYHTWDCTEWTLLHIDCNRWEPSGNRLTISSNIIHYFVTVHFWNSDIQYTTIFVRQIIRILLNQDPALLLQLKVSLYRHSSLYFCDQTLISSLLSIDYIYKFFLCCIERRLFINSKKGILGNIKIHLSNKQRSITTAFLPAIRY